MSCPQVVANPPALSFSRAFAAAPILAIVLIGAAGPALGAEPVQANPPEAAKPEDSAPKPDKPKKERLICRHETPTGSHVVKRVCRTEEVVEKDRKTAETVTNRRDGVNSPVRLDYVPTGKRDH